MGFFPSRAGVTVGPASTRRALATAMVRFSASPLRAKANRLERATAPRRFRVRSGHSASGIACSGRAPMPMPPAAFEVTVRPSLGVGEKVPQRLQRIRSARDYRPHPPLRHAAGKAFSEGTRDNGIDAVQRMPSIPMERLHRHVLGQFEALEFHGRFTGIGSIDEEPSRASRVRRDGSKVLAGDCDLHRCSP